jgi:raffinose/stachyose/melibiose transport system substrate-binding protein
MKRLILCGMFMLVPWLVFSGGRSEAQASSAGVISVDYWHFRTEDVAAYDGIIAKFEAQNPGIKIKQNAIKNTEYNTVLSAALQGGEPPDIVMLRPYGGLEAYVEAKYLEPLDDKIPHLKNFSPDVIGAAKSIKDGKIYGVPFAVRTIFVYYNVKMYKSLGLKEPETWAEFLANLDAMKKAGIEPLANGGKDGWTLEILHGVVSPNFYGGTRFFDDVVGGTTNFLDPRYIRSINVLKDLVPYFPDMFMSVSYTDMQAAFFNEIAGHFIGGDFEAGYFSAQNPALEYNMFAAPVEKRGDPRYVSVWSDGAWGLTSASKKKDAAVKFLEFMSRTESQQYMSDTLKTVSGAPGVTSADPILRRILELRKTTTPYMHLVAFRYGQPTGSTIVQSGLQGFFMGQLSAEDLGRQLNEGIGSWYSKLKK